MSMMRRGDEDLHYSDNSHRWIAPRNVDQDLWEAGVRAHLAHHLAVMGGPVPIDQPLACRQPPRIPHPRQPLQLARRRPERQPR
jgi:hypothetical protein